MISIALAVLLDPSPPIKVAGPMYACREFIVGPELTPPGGIWLQLAFQRPTDVTYSKGGISGNEDINQNYGYGSVEVTVGDVAGEPCRVVKWRSVYRPPRKGIEDISTRYWYVKPDGTLLRYSEKTTSVLNNQDNGTRQATITFTGDSAFVQRATATERREFEVPLGGREALVQNLFKPMYEKGKVNFNEKKVAWLDPFTGKWQEWTIVHRSKWNGRYNQKVVGGEAFNIETDAGYFSTYLTPESDVFDVRFNENFRYIPDEVRAIIK